MYLLLCDLYINGSRCFFNSHLFLQGYLHIVDQTKQNFLVKYKAFFSCIMIRDPFQCTQRILIQLSFCVIIFESHRHFKSSYSCCMCLLNGVKQRFQYLRSKSGEQERRNMVSVFLLNGYCKSNSVVPFTPIWFKAFLKPRYHFGESARHQDCNISQNEHIKITNYPESFLFCYIEET